MRQGQSGLSSIELTREIALPGDVCFDSEKMSLLGFYGDQLSAYRAKNTWVETLENCFLLDAGHDYRLLVKSDYEKGEFILSCEFLSACGRYAFWRLTNHQAPEAQYVIETAHIPQTDSNCEAIASAPDLRPLVEKQLQQLTNSQKTLKNLLDKIKDAAAKLV